MCCFLKMKRQSEQSVVGPVFQQRRVVPQQRVFEFEISVVLRNSHVHRNVDHHRLRMHFGVRRMQPVPHPLQGQFPHNVPRANQMPITTTVVAVLAAVATTTPFAPCFGTCASLTSVLIVCLATGRLQQQTLQILDQSFC